jgi:hypothetical protein
MKRNFHFVSARDGLDLFEKSHSNLTICHSRSIMLLVRSNDQSVCACRIAFVPKASVEDLGFRHPALTPDETACRLATVHNGAQ